VRRQNSEYRIKEDSELQTQNSENGIWVKVFAPVSVLLAQKMKNTMVLLAMATQCHRRNLVLNLISLKINRYEGNNANHLKNLFSLPAGKRHT
jgi:hypothetical protein